MKLTTANVDLPEGKDDVIFFDDKLTGFCLRVRRGSGGRILRRWFVQYRFNNSTRRFSIGDAEKVTAVQAREAARKELAKVELGQDPQADKMKARAAGTLRDVIDLYIEAKTPEWRERTRYIQTRYLTGESFRSLHSLPVDKISRADVASRVLSITKASGASTAMRARATLSACFVWALGQGLVAANPVVGTVIPKQAKSRDRVLSDAELAEVWRAAGTDAYGSILKLLILTGCRRQEVGGMTWLELDLDGAGTWTIPKARSKNHREHVLPILPAMREIIDRVPMVDGRDHLFGFSAADGFSAWALGKKALDQRLGDSVKQAWTIHDVRRSVATGMANLNVEPHHIEAVLNHYSGHRSGVAGIYNRSAYEKQIRTALALWADHIAAITSGTGRKVLPFAANVGGAS